MRAGPSACNAAPGRVARDRRRPARCTARARRRSSRCVPRRARARARRPCWRSPDPLAPGPRARGKSRSPARAMARRRRCVRRPVAPLVGERLDRGVEIARRPTAQERRRLRQHARAPRDVAGRLVDRRHGARPLAVARRQPRRDRQPHRQIQVLVVTPWDRGSSSSGGPTSPARGSSATSSKSPRRQAMSARRASAGANCGSRSDARRYASTAPDSSSRYRRRISPCRNRISARRARLGVQARQAAARLGRLAIRRQAQVDVDQDLERHRARRLLRQHQLEVVARRRPVLQLQVDAAQALAHVEQLDRARRAAGGAAPLRGAAPRRRSRRGGARCRPAPRAPRRGAGSGSRPRGSGSRPRTPRPAPARSARGGRSASSRDSTSAAPGDAASEA